MTAKEFLMPPQPIYLGEMESRYTDTGELPKVPKYTCTLFLQRSPQWNLALSYRVFNQSESLYVAVMAIADKLKRMSIDMDNISEATFIIGEWDARIGNHVVIIPQKTITLNISSNDAKTVTNIIGRMVSVALSHCMLIAGVYYADNMPELKMALVTNHGIPEDVVKKDEEPIATYATVIVNDISETMTMENPFSIVFRYVHPEFDEQIWAAKWPDDKLKVIEKYATEFHIEVPSLLSTMTTGIVIKDYTRKDDGVETEVSIAKVKQIAQFAMFLLSYRLFQQYPGSPTTAVPWAGFQNQLRQRQSF